MGLQGDIRYIISSYSRLKNWVSGMEGRLLSVVEVKDLGREKTFDRFV